MGSEMKLVLTENENLLMEPFSNDYDPRLDSDSIYTLDMDRAQKLDTYSIAMDARIQQAKSADARIILNAMKTFVLNFDNNNNNNDDDDDDDYDDTATININDK